MPERTDLRFDAIGSTGEHTLSVVGEVKGCWNSRLFQDIEKQLVDRYMLDTRTSVGLYIIGWFDLESWDMETRAGGLPPQDPYLGSRVGWLPYWSAWRSDL